MLPKYRGSAPIQWAVLNGDKTTGVTIMYLNEQMDAGDIIIQEETEIGEYETSGELWNRLSTVGARLLIESVKKIEEGTVERKVQPEEFTLAPMLDKAMAKINWNEKSAIEIKNLVRGLNPIMGTYSFMNGKKIKFWRVFLLDNEQFLKEADVLEFKIPEDAKLGEVILSNPKKGLFIKAKDGIISVSEIQGENAKKMDIKDFLRGNNISVGEIFE